MAFKDLFIKTDETPSAAPVSQNTVTPKATTPMQPLPNVAEAPVVASISSNEEIVGKIWNTIISKNLPGPDYLELKNNVSALKNLPISEMQKLESAFNILKVNYPNFTKETILKSIDTYINIVEEEKNGGLEEVKNIREEKIVSNERLIASLNEKAESLKKEYEATMAKIAEISTQINIDKADIDSKEATFVGSVDTVLNTLKNDKAQISTLNI